jgi:hypothetical protein
MKIKVGYLYYDIEELSFVETNGNILLNGECNHETLKISIKNSLVPSRKRQVLLHEILHAITDNLELHLTEEEIEMTSIGLSMFIVDNIPFIKKLIKEVEDKKVDKE